MRGVLISLLFFNILLTGYRFYFTEVKKDFHVLSQIDDSTRIVEYNIIGNNRTGLERKINSEYVQTTYCYSNNCTDLKDCIDWLYYKEQHNF
jgi:hypothetical protein